MGRVGGVTGVFNFKKTEVIGGVKLWLNRDAVEGKTFYYHQSDKHLWKQRGIFPYIGRSDGGETRFRVEFRSGRARNDMGYDRAMRGLTINIDGHKFDIDCEVICHFPGGLYYQANMPAQGQVFEILQQLAKSSVAVVRFKASRMQYRSFDTKVEFWNKPLIADMLTAFRAMEPPPKQAPAPETPSGSPTGMGAGEVKAGTEKRYRFGPFVLTSDGSISDPEGKLRLPAGVHIGEIRLEGYTLKSHASGGYLGAGPDGSQRLLLFKDGRWFAKSVS